MGLKERSAPATSEDVSTEANQRACPECGGSVTEDGVETVCNECGLVLAEDALDPGPEWRAYDAEECERTGAPLTATRHDRGLSTELTGTRDSNGNPVSSRKRRQLARLRREQTRGRWRSKAERNLAHGLGEVQRLVSVLDLGESIREQACALFRQAQDAGLLPGRSIEAMAAASVYGTCRCAGLSRRLEAVSEPARVDEDRVRNAYSVLNTELGLPAQLMHPSGFIPQFASELDVSDIVQHRALELASRAEEAGVTNGRQPSGFAAACLYKAAREYDHRVTQGEVAAIADTSVMTLRTHRDTLDDLDAVSEAD